MEIGVGWWVWFIFVKLIDEFNGVLAVGETSPSFFSNFKISVCKGKLKQCSNVKELHGNLNLVIPELISVHTPKTHDTNNESPNKKGNDGSTGRVRFHPTDEMHRKTNICEVRQTFVFPVFCFDRVIPKSTTEFFLTYEKEMRHAAKTDLTNYD